MEPLKPFLAYPDNLQLAKHKHKKVDSTITNHLG